jgi:hypothetical protein
MNFKKHSRNHGFRRQVDAMLEAHTAPPKRTASGRTLNELDYYLFQFNNPQNHRFETFEFALLGNILFVSEGLPSLILFHIILNLFEAVYPKLMRHVLRFEE